MISHSSEIDNFHFKGTLLTHNIKTKRLRTNPYMIWLTSYISSLHAYIYIYHHTPIDLLPSRFPTHKCKTRSTALILSSPSSMAVDLTTIHQCHDLRPMFFSSGFEVLWMSHGGDWGRQKQLPTSKLT